MDLLAGTVLLLTVSFLLKGAAGQKLDIIVARTRWCPDYYPNRGLVYMYGSALLQDAEIPEYSDKLYIYIGQNRSHYMWICIIYFDHPPCHPPPFVQAPGCWCTDARDGFKTHDFQVRVPVNHRYRGKDVQIAWESLVDTRQTVRFATPAVPDFDHPVASLIINGKRLPFTGDRCPMIYLTEDANIRFCMDYLYIPRVAISFNDRKYYPFYQPCGQKFLDLDSLGPNKTLYFNYRDGCQRRKTYKCPLAGRMNLRVHPAMSCKNKYIDGSDVVYVTGSVYLMDAGPDDYEKSVSVYVGTEEDPMSTSACPIILDSEHCEHKELDRGCWCDRVHERGKVFDLRIKMPVTMDLNGKIVTVVWRAVTDEFPSQQYNTPTIQVIERARASVEINGQRFTLTKDECPMFPVDVITNITFCVKNLQNPELIMQFDGNRTYYYNSTCGYAVIKLEKRFKTTPFWFSYADSCRKAESIMCPQNSIFSFGCLNVRRVKAESCKAQVMDNLMALVVLAYLLKANM